MVTCENGQYSVPAHLLGVKVFVRSHGVGADEQVIVFQSGFDGAVEAARHQRARPGSPAIDNAYFFDHREKMPGDCMIKAKSVAEAELLSIGSGVHPWLLEAVAAGTARMNVKIAETVTPAAINSTAKVNTVLDAAATYARFAIGGLAVILAAGSFRGEAHRADEKASWAKGTSGWAASGWAAIGWAAIGQPVTSVFEADADDDLEGKRMGVTQAAVPTLPEDIEALIQSS